jgi:hypothetical protein
MGISRSGEPAVTTVWGTELGTTLLTTFRRKNEQPEADRALLPKSEIDKGLLSEAFL